MKPFVAASLALFTAVSICANAQWLKQPTPNIPRIAEGKPDLAAPPPRLADGHPDLSGVWTNRGAAFIGSDDTLTPAAKELVRAREENYFKDRPAFQCTDGAGDQSVFQTDRPDADADHHPLRRPHVSFDLHGRARARARSRTHVDGLLRWTLEGDTLVVDSFGFNDRTWLDARGLPHTEALRLTERYRRSTVGEMLVQVTAVDPGVLTTPGQLLTRGHSNVGNGAAHRASELDGRKLYASGLLGEPVRLIPQSDTFFMGADGLTFEFGGDGGAVTYLVERHVSGDWKYARRP